jgi:transposase-like protein
VVRDVAVLSVIGIGPDEYLQVLGVSCALSEAEVHWGAFFESLLKRGMSGVQFVVSDDHSGLKSAMKTVFGGLCGNVASSIRRRMPFTIRPARKPAIPSRELS